MNSITTNINYRNWEEVNSNTENLLDTGGGELSKTKKWIMVALAVASIACVIVSAILLSPLIASCIGIPVAILGAYAIEKLANHLNALIDRELKKENNGDNLFNEDVIIVIFPKSDYNGTCSINDTMLSLIDQKKYPVVFKDASCLYDIAEIIEKMKEQDNHIHALWINSHGSTDSFTLGETNDLLDDVVELRKVINGINDPEIASDLSDTNEVELAELDEIIEFQRAELEECFEELDEDTVIVLDSCSTGKIDEEGNSNIAQTIASLAPGRRVIAPIRDSLENSAYIRDIDTMDVRFRDEKRTKYRGLLGDIIELFNQIAFETSNGRYSTDITATFLDTRKIDEDPMDQS